MNCKNAQSLLSAYLDEELSGREMLEIREHVFDCSACANELDSVQAVKRILCATPIAEPSADFENRLVAHVLSASPAPLQKRISLLALTGIAAASMLGTLLLLNSMQRENASIAEQRDSVPFDLVERGRAFEASADPMSGSPVMLSKR
jgi:anti-sigma factor RsiW